MDTFSTHQAEIRAAIARAREDPHTDWVMNMYEWTGGLLLILCLLPALRLAWKSENFRVLWRSILWGWAGLFLWHVCMGGIAPFVVIGWTGETVLTEVFPSRGILPAALFGWFASAIISFPVCSLGILWRYLRGTQKSLGT